GARSCPINSRCRSGPRACDCERRFTNQCGGRQAHSRRGVCRREGRSRRSRARVCFAQLNDNQGGRLAAPRAMRASTMFDLASVTKVMATTMATMLLVDRDKIELDAPVYRYLPDFRGPHLDSITVRHLLSHSGGLVQWQPL